ncbi:DUF1189 family protein [Alkalihalobacillus sp. FSL W8-0930]
MRFFTWFLKSMYHRQSILASRFRQTIHILGHVCFTILIALIPYCLVLSVSIWSGITHIEQALVEQNIDFTIREGFLQTTIEPTPSVVELHQTNQLIMDPDNQLSVDQLDSQAILMQEQSVVFHTANVNQALPYTLLGDDVFTTSDILEQLSDIKSFLPILLGIISIIILSVMIGVAFMGISLLAFVGRFLQRSNPSITYVHLWKIAAHTITLPVIFYAWIIVIGDFIPLFLWIGLVIALYSYFILQLPQKKKSRKTD